MHGVKDALGFLLATAMLLGPLSAPLFQTQGGTPFNAAAVSPETL
jgi:hypothetical protein